MKNLKNIIFIALFSPVLLFAQPVEKREVYDISKDKVLYTIGYAHLDSEWNWDYPTTINEYIKNTMEDNFELFEKYPEYVFNFTGSRRYNMMKEYYPEMYEKVKEYVKQGRWYVSGSSVDEGEVNVSSSESLLRQVLYGNNFFRKEFGKESYDYMLPDCFGFLANAPTIWNHAGLLGFSTQKLTWNSAAGIPFNVGVWNGPDGKGIIAALNATNYVGRVVERLDQNNSWNTRINENISKYDVSFDYRYYGVGDVGGAPREEDVKNAIGSLKKSDAKFKVVLTQSDQMFKDITPEIRKKLPTFTGDLLLIEHSAGSLTSQTYMKRSNRKNEFLAKSAEQLASFADWIGSAGYPYKKINDSWDLVLGSQFHDILPGTSIPKAYEYAWNDEFIAMNGFSEVLKNSLSAISRELNTSTQGRAIVVYNPVAKDREDLVTAELEYTKLPNSINVIDKNGNVLNSQIISREGNILKIIFSASVPSVGLAVFDILESSKNPTVASALSVTNETLENEYYKVKIGTNGDILSIFDKKAGKELLEKPARLEFLQEHPVQWPAWNMEWKDRQLPPVDYMDKEATVEIIENGPVRVALLIKRKGRNSEINQVISLAAGDAGKRLEITNKLDWQSKGVSLKAAFPLAVSNDKATYNLGAGTIQRGNNNEIKFEVPSKEWIDLTDNSGNYGVSILEDCKYGSDKPDDNTLRLTLIYSPRANSYLYQSTQDWGIHDIKYGVYGHEGDWVKGETPWQGRFLNQPLLAFEVPKHNGKLGKEISLLKINSSQVGLMAFKKMEDGDYYIVRVNELFGKDAKDINLSFPGKIVDAYEVNGQEKRIGSMKIENGSLNFDITHYTIRSFAVKFENPPAQLHKPEQIFVKIPYNQDAFTFDNDRSDGDFDNNMTLPAELFPEEIISEDISFKMGNFDNDQNNVVAAKGQEIKLPEGNYNKLYLLAAATVDTKADFKIDGHTNTLGIQDWTGYIGQHYNRKLYFGHIKIYDLIDPFLKRDNIAWYTSHRHTPSGNDAYQYSYLFKYEISLPENAKKLVLPDNNNIKIFAVTLANNNNDNISALQPLYDDFKNNKPVQLRIKEYITNDLTPINVKELPLFIEDIPERYRSNRWFNRYLQSLGIDSIVKTLPSTQDYADLNTGNDVSMTYYATGSKNGEKIENKETDLSHVFNSQSGKLKDTLWFSNGEGRYLIDLQKSIPIEKINMYFNRNRDRGYQVFSIWGSNTGPVIIGDPKKNNWEYINANVTSASRRFSPTGKSIIFKEEIKYRYIMFVTDSYWHGSDYFDQMDIFEKK